MDAFAVSIGLGAKQHKSLLKVALLCGGYFGFFQGVMPLIGYLGGMGLLSWVEGFKHWLAFLLLFGIGAKMIYESYSHDADVKTHRLTHKIMCLLAIATSLDAMAAGFTLNLMVIEPIVACFFIGLITAIMSFVGVWVGNQSGTWLEHKAEMLGGIVLVLIGFKFIFLPES